MPIDIDRLRVLEGETVPKDVRAVIWPDGHRFVTEPHRYIERDEADVPADDVPQSYMDPRLKHSRS